MKADFFGGGAVICILPGDRDPENFGSCILEDDPLIIYKARNKETFVKGIPAPEKKEGGNIPMGANLRLGNGAKPLEGIEQ